MSRRRELCYCLRKDDYVIASLRMDQHFQEVFDHMEPIVMEPAEEEFADSVWGFGRT